MIQKADPCAKVGRCDVSMGCLENGEIVRLGELGGMRLSIRFEGKVEKGGNSFSDQRSVYYLYVKW